MKKYKDFINEIKKPTGELKDACWKGYTAVGMKMKGGRKVPNCVPEEVEIEENHIAVAMGKELDDEGSMVLGQIEQLERGIAMIRSYVGKDYEKQLPAWVQSKITLATDYIDTVGNYLSNKNEKVSEEIEQIEEGESMHHKLVYAISSRMKDTPQPRRAPKDAAEAESWARMERDKAALHVIAAKNAAQKEKERLVKEEVELDETAAWQRKEGKNPEGGLNQKGVESYRREHPGSKLKTAVTTKPSKLKPGSKAANRRKSFCARMSGMKKRLTSAKTAHDPDSRINKSLRKWNC